MDAAQGVNDGDDELDAIVRLLKGKYGVLSVIPSTTWKAMITSAPIPSASARSSAACTAVAC